MTSISSEKDRELNKTNCLQGMPVLSEGFEALLEVDKIEVHS
jgi:hypothetical protein